MRIKKLPNNFLGNEETTQKTFKFITLNKMEIFNPKATVRKNVINKNDNKYKFPPINNTNSHQSKRANFTGKHDEFNNT